jgi:hypothetical protein
MTVSVNEKSAEDMTHTGGKEHFSVFSNKEFAKGDAEGKVSSGGRIGSVHSSASKVVSAWMPRRSLFHTTNKRPSSLDEVILALVLKT